MSGIYVYWEPAHPKTTEGYSGLFNSGNQDYIKEEIRSGHLTAGRCIPNRFLNDRVFREDDQLVLLNEGIIYETTNVYNRIKAAWMADKTGFPKDLKGQFCGFIYHKKDEKIYLYTDVLSTKSLYYTKTKDGAVGIASEAIALANWLKRNNQEINIDPESILQLLTQGFLWDTHTPAVQIKKIPPASVMVIDLRTGKTKLHDWFSFKRVKPIEADRDTCSAKIEELLTKAVKLEWEKDISEGHSPLALLSGGLDSRVNVMLAHEAGFRDFKCLNFAQSESSDAKIARKICGDYDLDYKFLPLDDGTYLMEILEESIRANDALVACHGGSHLYYAIKKNITPKTGMVHSGQVGDVLFGSFAYNPQFLRDKIKLMGYHQDDQIFPHMTRFNDAIGRYRDNGGFERFSYEQRQPNLTLNGDRLVSHLTDHVSPFYDFDLIRYCASIPQKLKHKQGIYIDWINRYHPSVSNYRWSRTGVKPTGRLKNSATYNTTKYKNKIRSILRLNTDHMNPFQRWHDDNPELRSYLDNLYKKFRSNLHENELTGITDRYNQSKNIQQIMLSITAAAAMHYYGNGKVEI